MDNPGWHAYRRAQRDSVQDPPQRGPDGRFQPVEQIMPMNDGFIGGFVSQQSRRQGPPPHSPVLPPPPPPKDNGYLLPGAGQASSQGHSAWPIHDQQAPFDGGLAARTRHRSNQGSVSSSSKRSTLSQMTAIERSQSLRVVRMDPHLQLMAGPLLRYDTVDERGVWCGSCLVVTVDAGSVYDPHPSLTYEWDPERPTKMHRASSRRPGMSFELGPHPSDPDSSVAVALSISNGVHLEREQVPGHEIWVYDGNGGTFTFWRFMIQIPLAHHEMNIKYSINNGQELDFFVPGRDQNMRWAAYSCNGFSAGVNQDDFRGPGFKTGYDPVWVDLLDKHDVTPFHALIGGGDQLYCDGLTREPEFQEWINLPKPEMKKNYPLTEELELAIDRFYFNHYCHVFRSGAFARANSSIPMVNMADDHDLIDGFGSYPEDLQMSPVFRAIGARGYFFFLLFQCFINADESIDGFDDRPGMHSNKSLIIGGAGPYVPFPSHSFLTYLGPQCYMLLLDCRAERRKDQVCSQQEYNKVMARIYQLPQKVEHLVVQLGIPIAYPRMVFLEAALDSKFNPFVALGRKGSLGMSGLINKFNDDAELLDDLNDHWTAKSHKKERNWFIQQMQQYAAKMHIRVTFLSGDVHCAAVGVLKTLVKEKNQRDIPPSLDHRYMLNVVTSAIVNTPPPGGVLTMVSHLATKTHKTLHHANTDETMIPLFTNEPNGAAAKSKYVMGRRNWCSVRWDNATGDLEFDLRVEKVKGLGTTVGYQVRAPPPRWIA